MAPNIAKVDANSNLHPGVSARNFCNEVLRWFFHENSVLFLEDLLIPFLVTNQRSSTVRVSRPYAARKGWSRFQ